MFFTFCFIHCVWFFFYLFIFFNSIRGFAFTMVFNKLWVMERSPRTAECRRMLNAADRDHGHVCCHVLVYTFILLSCILLLNRTPPHHRSLAHKRARWDTSRFLHLFFLPLAVLYFWRLNTNVLLAAAYFHIHPTKGPKSHHGTRLWNV